MSGFFYKKVKKEDIMGYFANLSEADQKHAFRSFTFWILNPKWTGMENALLRNKMWSDLFELKNFFPASDRELALRIFRSLPSRRDTEYFTMIRLSQHEKPLTWVGGRGGKKARLQKARIGVRLMLDPETSKMVVTYTVRLNEDLAWKSPRLQKIMEILRDYYFGKGKRVNPWHNLLYRAPIRLTPEEIWG